ncbi:unnamed protein product [Arabis nemorensis]|uniref:Uncharacterized protein n=1 Tax=Arabis nemorensis TaxID=586526 RepID=A0A565BXL0_9BRAS|nr:unnamed protein product [Arabis nemorensis]
MYQGNLKWQPNLDDDHNAESSDLHKTSNAISENSEEGGEIENSEKLKMVPLNGNEELREKRRSWA